MTDKVYIVEGLTCTDCAERVQSAASKVEGVRACHADFATGKLTVSLDSPERSADAIEKAVQDAGYRLIAESRQDANPVLGFVRFIFSKRETTLVAVAALLTVLGLVFALVGLPHWARVTVFSLAIVVGGVPVGRAAFQEMTQIRSLGINTLMVIAVIGAVFIGEWAEAAIVVVLFSLGEALEGYAAEQARGALQGLLDLAPPTALRISPDGGTEEVPVEQIAVGEKVLVRPGDRVSVDGVVLGGNSAVDQSPITGESVPVEKIPGDEVFAGTINTTGALEIEVTRLAEDNTLSRMVALVQEAQAHRAPVQRFIDRFARVYTPAVTGLAVLVAAVPPLVFGQPFLGERGWLMRALQMLVIACPCALVISTPVSLVSAMTNAARRGVLIKGGRTLEALSRVTTFAFDKTGTLTRGRPIVTDVVDVCTCGECDENCGLEHAAALEIQSSHPLAQAVLAEARARDLAVPPAQGVNVLSGRGMQGTVNGVTVTVASHDHFDEHFPHPEDVCQLADQLAAEGKTVIMVQHDGKVCGLFGVADAARPDSREVIDTLKRRGIRTLMLTGDNLIVAEEIGRQVGVDGVQAQLLPEDKVDAIAGLVEEGETVAMVGDGVNDAPALAQASVGVAMGGAGSAQAMETADVVLMGDDLSQLPFIVWLSRKTRSIVSANIALALGIKAVIFILAAAGWASLWMAIVADVGASLAVILNGMRLRGV